MSAGFAIFIVMVGVWMTTYLPASIAAYEAGDTAAMPGTFVVRALYSASGAQVDAAVMIALMFGGAALFAVIALLIVIGKLPKQLSTSRKKI